MNQVQIREKHFGQWPLNEIKDPCKNSGSLEPKTKKTVYALSPMMIRCVMIWP